MFEYLSLTQSKIKCLYVTKIHLLNRGAATAQKMKFFIKNFFSKCDQICSFLRVWSHLLKNP